MGIESFFSLVLNNTEILSAPRGKGKTPTASVSLEEQARIAKAMFSADSLAHVWVKGQEEVLDKKDIATFYVELGRILQFLKQRLKNTQNLSIQQKWNLIRTILLNRFSIKVFDKHSENGRDMYFIIDFLNKRFNASFSSMFIYILAKQLERELNCSVHLVRMPGDEYIVRFVSKGNNYNLYKGNICLDQFLIQEEKISSQNLNKGYFMVNLNNKQIANFYSIARVSVEFRNGNVRKGVYLYQTIYQNDPHNLFVLLILSRIYAQNKNVEKARLYLEQYNKLYSEDRDSCITKGIIYLFEGKDKLAIQAFTQSLNIEQSGIALYFRGLVYSKAKDYSNAARDSLAAYQLGYDALDNLSFLVQALFKIGKLLQFIQRIEQKAKNHPDFTRFCLLAFAYLDLKRKQEASNFLMKAISVGGENRYFILLRRLVNVVLTAEKTEKIFSWLENHWLENQIKIHPQQSDLYFMRSQILLKKQDINGALRDLRQAFSLSPNNIDFITHYIQMLFDTKKYSEALPPLKRLLELRPSAIVYKGLAIAYFMCAQYRLAYENYQRMLQLDPTLKDESLERAIRGNLTIESEIARKSLMQSTSKPSSRPIVSATRPIFTSSFTIAKNHFSASNIVHLLLRLQEKIVGPKKIDEVYQKLAQILIFTKEALQKNSHWNAQQKIYYLYHYILLNRFGFAFVEGTKGFAEGVLQKKFDCDELALIFLVLCAELKEHFPGKMSAVIVPEHMFLRYEEPNKKAINFDRGQIVSEQYYIRYFQIDEDSIQKKVYLNSLSLKQLKAYFYLIRGDLYRENNKWHEAISDLEYAKNLDPQNISIYLNLALIYFKQRRHKEALNLLSQALNLDKKSVIAYRGRGEIYFSLGRYQESFINIQNALKYKSFAEEKKNISQSYQMMIWLNIEFGQYALALKNYLLMVQQDSSLANEGLDFLLKMLIKIKPLKILKRDNFSEFDQQISALLKLEEQFSTPQKTQEAKDKLRYFMRIVYADLEKVKQLSLEQKIFFLQQYILPIKLGITILADEERGTNLFGQNVLKHQLHHNDIALLIYLIARQFRWPVALLRIHNALFVRFTIGERKMFVLGKNLVPHRSVVSIFRKFNKEYCGSPLQEIPWQHIQAYYYYLVANKYLLSNDLVKALEFMKKAIQIAPQQGFLYFELGRILVVQRNYTLALLAYSRAVDLGETNIHNYLPIMSIFFEMKKFHQVIRVADAAISQCPQFAYALVFKGAALIERGKMTKALKVLNEALIIDYRIEKAYFYRGQAYYNLGQENPAFFSKAIDDFARVLSINPKSAEAYWSRSLCFYDQKKYREALQDYLKAVSLDPSKKKDDYHNLIRQGLSPAGK